MGMMVMIMVMMVVMMVIIMDHQVMMVMIMAKFMTKWAGGDGAATVGCI